MRRSSWPILALTVIATACAGALDQPASTQNPSVLPSRAPSSPPSAAPAEPSGDPTGGMIAYVTGIDDPQIHLLDLASGEARQLTQLRPEDAELTGEGPLRPVLSCGFGPYALSWSPDGSQLAFTYGSCDTVVFVVTVAGELRRIGDGRSPTWSPDGTRLLFAANVPYSPCGRPCEGQPPPAPGALDLRIVDVVGGGAPQPFTDDGATSMGAGPSYSPDGALVAFSGPSQGVDPEVFGATYLVHADGSGVRLLAEGGYPSGWLPDGRVLVRREGDGSIHAISVNSGESAPIGPPQTISVSADGTRSLVSTTDPVSGAPGLRLVTVDGDVLGETQGTFGAWAPDSASFAVFGSDERLHVVSRDGALLASYDIGAVDGPAAWRPDS